MTSFTRRGLQGFDPRWADIDAVGGLHVVPPNTTAEVLREAAGQGFLRAVEVHDADLAVLADFPIEFLFSIAPGVDATPINRLTRLRGLWLDSWSGDLVVSRLRNLEWFGVVEVERGQLDELFENGHPTILRLSVGKYREPDVTSLARLPHLTSLAVVDSRSLTSLDGIGELPRLATVDLAMCPKLASLDGIEAARKLQAVTLASCNQLKDLNPLADLPDLRVVQVEMRTTPSLAPLAAHPTLECVWVVGRKPPADEIEALLDTPSVRMINAGRATWLRSPGGWEHFDNIYAMTEKELELREQFVAAVNSLKFQ